MTKRRLSSRSAAITIGVGLSAIVLVPTAIAAISAASTVPELVSTVQGGQRQVPSPPERLKELPLIGQKAHAAWMQASTDMPAFTKQYSTQIAGFTRSLLRIAGGLFTAVLVLVLAIVFAAICLAYSVPLRAYIGRVFARITGDAKSGEHYMQIISATVKSVANGVIGVAFVQALLVGIGFFVAGVPGAGVLSLLMFALGVVQVPIVIVVLPVVIWAFAVKATTFAIIFAVWSIIGSLSDAVLKPLMIGHGLEVPMPVILLGVIGGVITFGLVGLFIGAVVLAVGYVLFSEWVGPAATPVKSTRSPAKRRALQAAE